MATEKQRNVLHLIIFFLSFRFMIIFIFAVKIRIAGTKNIAKITKSMKMVSAAKFRGDQQRLAAGMPFAVSSCMFSFHRFHSITSFC
jgi:hypothetical protein